jgi:hypothetical protein
MNATKGGWFSSAQRFFTRMPFTHVAVKIDNVMGMPSYFEANMVATIVPSWTYEDNATVEYEIFQPIARETSIRSAVSSIYARYAGSTYGYTQVLYFVWRWFFGLFGKDIRKWKNPIPNGDICSEIVYVYIRYLASLENRQEILDYLDEWNENTVHAGDIHTICTRFPWFFKPIKTI